MCHAQVEGDTIGSTHVTFKPGPVRAGQYHFKIGTAGSTTLVLQSVLPALMLADNPSTVVLEGGTHNPFAPPYDFLVKAFLPLLARMGPVVEAALQRPGFYPAGGGRFTIKINPVEKLKPLEVLTRSQVTRRHAHRDRGESSPSHCRART